MRKSITIKKSESNNNPYNAIDANIWFGTVMNDHPYGDIIILDGQCQLHRADRNIADKKYKAGEKCFFITDDKGEVTHIIDPSTFEHIKTHPIYDAYRTHDNFFDCYIPFGYLEEKENFILNPGTGYMCVVRYKKENKNYIGWLRHGKDHLDMDYYFQEVLDISPETISQKIDDIQRYVDEFDIEEELKKFKVKYKETFICRPGKDDSYYCDKSADLPEDAYLCSILPCIAGRIYSDRGFCEAHSMSIHPNDDDFYNETEQYRESAKKEYSKEKHFQFLVKKCCRDFLFKQNLYYEGIIGHMKSFTLGGLSKTLNDFDSDDCIEEFNEFTKKYWNAW